MERLLDEVSFEAPDLAGQEITVDRDYVRRRLEDVLTSEDLSRYIL
jgi:ATP-dependent HslUV protease ATP-binding subunit HslU